MPHLPCPPIAATPLPVSCARPQIPAEGESLPAERLPPRAIHRPASALSPACNRPPHNLVWRGSPHATPPPPPQNLLAARVSRPRCNARPLVRDPIPPPCEIPPPLPEAGLSASVPGRGRSATWHPAVRVRAPLETRRWRHRSPQFEDKPPPNSLCIHCRRDAAGWLPETLGWLPGRLHSARRRDRDYCAHSNHRDGILWPGEMLRSPLRRHP